MTRAPAIDPAAVLAVAQAVRVLNRALRQSLQHESPIVDAAERVVGYLDVAEKLLGIRKGGE